MTDGATRRLFRPRHVRQMAEILDAAHSRADEEGELYLGQTSLGLRISASTLRQAGRDLDLFAFSWRDGVLSERAARRLARLLSRLHRYGGEVELLRGRHGVYQLLLPHGRSSHAV